MIRSDLSTSGVLNAIGFYVRRVTPPATAVLLLTALPLRLMQVQFIDLLSRLRGEAMAYGHLLTATAALMVCSFALAVYGRAVYMRACRDMPDRWSDLLRVRSRPFVGYLYVSLLLATALLLFGVTLIAIPLVIVLSGVAAVASTDDAAVGPVASLRALSPYIRRSAVLIAIFIVFVMAWFVVALNLWFFAKAAVWALGAIPAFDAVRWRTAVEGGSPRFILLILATATTVIEPFWFAAVHVYGDRVRSLQSGDDLRRRFRTLLGELRLIEGGAAALIVCALTLPLAAQQSITIDTYIVRLTSVRDALVSSSFADVIRTVHELDDVTSVTSKSGSFHPDRSLIEAARKSAQDAKAHPGVIRRLAVTIAALQETGPGTAAVTADPKLLERVRKQEQVGELWRGGEVMQIPSSSTSVFEQIGAYLGRLIDWLAEKLEAIVDWIMKLWPKRSEREDETFLGMPVVVWIVTILVVATVALVGVYVLRRSRRRVANVASKAIAASRRDEDPLSREANEWESYALQLADSGRFREAIRAWYHAVLVTLYRTGTVHYRKGKTNWEYVRALSPELAWRPSFVWMTREFEREWYGQHEVTPDNLESCAREARTILAAVRGVR